MLDKLFPQGRPAFPTMSELRPRDQIFPNVHAIDELKKRTIPPSMKTRPAMYPMFLKTQIMIFTIQREALSESRAFIVGQEAANVAGVAPQVLLM